MPSNPIIFSAPTALSNAASRWMTLLREHWPGTGGARFGGQRPPVMRSLTPDALVEMVSPSGDRGPLPGAAVVVFAADEPAWRIDRVVEALRNAHVPGVVLLPDPGAWRSLRNGGVLFEAWDTEPAVVAAMVYALAARQEDMDLLEREVGLTRRCERSIREEMDRLHEELHLAASIQREFTGAPAPRVAGLRFDVLSRPVSFVSGDVSCLREVGDGRLAFLLADAAGHGVPAALLTMVLTHALATHEAAHGGGVRVLEPADVLTRLNRRLCEHCRGSAWFATALYGVMDARTGEVTVASAGHPRPMILGAAGVREIAAEGPVLGLIADAEFEQRTATVRAGETLLLYTDGLECVFSEEGAGPARGTGVRPPAMLAEVGADPEGHPPDVLLRRLAQLMDEQVGSLHQADDVTVVAIAPERVAMKAAA